MSPRPLPPSPSVESLRKQAKQLSKAWSRGDSEARARVETALGNPVGNPTLREAQRVVAVEYGFSSWSELRRAVAVALADRGVEAAAADDLHALADRFVDLACLRYAYGPDSPGNVRHAERLLDRHPEIAAADVYVLSALGDAERLAALLAAKPELVDTVGGQRKWQPLLYLCYSRVPQRDALGAARVLLDGGADVNAHYFSPPPDGPYKYTALTGVFGLGESGPAAEPPHAVRDALARLLLEAGADPNDGQVLYQCHFTPDDSYLDILLEYGMDTPWLGPYLAKAAEQGFRERVRLLLAHGADPNAVKRPWSERSAYELALLHGHPDIAEELVRAGARRVELSPEDAFQAASFAGDLAAARALAAANPALLSGYSLLGTAAANGNLAAVRTLLELGIALNPPDEHDLTALHQAAWFGHAEVAKELVARGADVDRRERNHWSPAAGWARYAGKLELANWLIALSNDLFEVVNHGHTGRLVELLDRDPARVRSRDGVGHTVLHCVDVDEPDPKRIVALLIERGAPIGADSAAPADTAMTKAGETPLGRFLRLGADDLADLLIEHGASE
jgi:ankyrin repeat protein